MLRWDSGCKGNVCGQQYSVCLSWSMLCQCKNWLLNPRTLLHVPLPCWTPSPTVHFYKAASFLRAVFIMMQVEWATMLGDMPKKHSGLVQEFCHALTDNHSYYRWMPRLKIRQSCSRMCICTLVISLKKNVGVIPQLHQDICLSELLLHVLWLAHSAPVPYILYILLVRTFLPPHPNLWNSSNLLAALCDDEDESNDEGLMRVAKAVKGTVCKMYALNFTLWNMGTVTQQT